MSSLMITLGSTHAIDTATTRTTSMVLCPQLGLTQEEVAAGPDLARKILDNFWEVTNDGLSNMERYSKAAMKAQLLAERDDDLLAQLEAELDEAERLEELGEGNDDTVFEDAMEDLE